MGYSLKIIGENMYVPKTPYIETEMANGYVTNDTNRVAVYKHLKVAENKLASLQPVYENKLEIVPSESVTVLH